MRTDSVEFRICPDPKDVDYEEQPLIYIGGGTAKSISTLRTGTQEFFYDKKRGCFFLKLTYGTEVTWLRGDLP